MSSDMAQPQSGNDNLVKNSSLYREFQAEREEILKHKWIESEKAGYDLGESAYFDWVDNHSSSVNISVKKTLSSKSK